MPTVRPATIPLEISSLSPAASPSGRQLAISCQLKQKKAQVLFLVDLLGVLPDFSARGSCEEQSWTLPEPLGLSQWNVGRDDQ